MNKKYIFILILIITPILLLSQNEEELDKLYEEKREFKEDVYKKTLKYLKDNPNTEHAAKLYFNLAEMSTEINVGQPGKTASFYKKVLNINPDFSPKDIVFYNIGYYTFRAVKQKRDNARLRNPDKVINWPDSLRLSEEDLKLAIRSYKYIMEYLPESEYHSEAIYRLGTLYFELALDSRNPQPYYEKSLEHFNRLVEKGDDEFQNLALYQRGWTYFSKGEFKKAIDDFSVILAKISRDSLSKKKVYFEADAIDNIAFSLIEYDGTDFQKSSLAADKAKEIFKNFVNKDYVEKIILKAIELKQKYYAPMQAIDLYNAFIDMYPNDIKCPLYVDSIITIYKQNPDRTRDDADPKDLIFKQFEKLINKYPADSEWFTANADKNIEKQLSIIKDAYEFVEKRYYNNFVKENTVNNFEAYANLVENYLKFDTFDDIAYIKTLQKRLVDLSLAIAEKTNNPSYYFLAIMNINKFTKKFPEHDMVPQYRKDHLYCYNKIYTLLETSIQDSAYTDTINNFTLTENYLDTLMISACDDYEEFLNKKDYENIDEESELIKTISIRADLRYEKENFEKALNDYKKLLNYDLAEEKKKDTYAVVAYIYQQQDEYDLAEKYYRQAIDYANEEEVEVFRGNILVSMKESADNSLNSENFEKAATEYLRLASELEKEDPNQSISYILDAIKVYRKAGEYQKAIDLYKKIAQKKEKIEEVYTAYKSAWTMADSLLNDYEQSKALRNKFIEQYPTSNQAYFQRLEIIDMYRSGPFKDSDKAVEMYLDLAQKADEIDTGSDTEESIFLNAIRVYQENNQDDKFIDLVYQFAEKYPKNDKVEGLLFKVADIYDKRNDVEAMISFEKKYPNHPASNSLLKKVAYIYHKNNEKGKYEDIARYLYKKDPSIDLLSEIAAKKLKKIKTEIDSLFQAQKYDEMFTRIEEFNNTEQEYENEGMTFDLEGFHKRFDYYKNYVDFHKRFDEVIAQAEEDFFNKSAGQLIRVNELTTWKKHLYGGRKRFTQLMNKCDSYSNKLLDLIQEGKEYEIKSQDITHAFYLSARVYDYSYDIVLKQVNKYLNVAKEINEEAVWKERKLLQQQTKDRLLQTGEKIAYQFKKKAVKYYRSLYTNFKQAQNYSDKWVDLAEKELINLGIIEDKIYQEIYCDSNWLINKNEIDNFETNKNIDSIWIEPNFVDENTYKEKSKIINIDADFEQFVVAHFEAEIEPELINIEYIYNKPVTILINGNEITKESALEDSIKINNQLLNEYFLNSTQMLNSGRNEIVFKLNNSSQILNSYFSAKLISQYSKKEIEFYRTTERNKLITDNQWLSKQKAIDIEDIVIDSSWTRAGEAKFMFFKPQMYNLEETPAEAIWASELDSTQIDTTYFYRKLVIDNDIIDANIKVLAQNELTFWINGNKVIEDRELVYDENLKKAVPFETDIDLNKGENILLAKVIGDQKYKGFLLELNYTTRKPDEEAKLDLDQQKNMTEIDPTEETLEREVNIATPDTMATETDIEETVEEEKLDETKVDEQSKVDSTETLERNAKTVEDTIETGAEIDTASTAVSIASDDSTEIIEENTEKEYLISDYTWYTKKGDFNYLVEEPDTSWTLVGKDNFDYSYQEINGFENSNVIGIWFPGDENADENVYFLKEFYVNKNPNSAKIKFYTPGLISVWINNKLIIEEFDFEQNQEAEEIFVDNLISGENIIFVKVKNASDVNGFLFELSY